MEGGKCLTFVSTCVSTTVYMMSVMLSMILSRCSTVTSDGYLLIFLSISLEKFIQSVFLKAGKTFVLGIAWAFVA